MIIQYSRQTLAQNIIAKVAHFLDIAPSVDNVDKTLLYLDEKNYEWLDREIDVAQTKLRLLVASLLSSDDVASLKDEEIEFDLSPSSTLQGSLLPFLFEDYIITYVWERWMAEVGVNVTSRIADLTLEIKGLSVVSTSRARLPYSLY